MPNSLFLQACNPSYSIYPLKPPSDLLDMDKADQAEVKEYDYYIDLTEGRGDDVVKRLRRTIAMSPNRPTLQLLSGAIGSGKTTELLRLKRNLERQGFVVIYSMADEYLPLGDLRVTEVWILMLYVVVLQMERQGLLQLSYLPNAIAEIESRIRLNGELGANIATSHPSGQSYALRLKRILKVLQSQIQQRFQLRHYLESRLESQLKGYLLMAAEELVGKEIERLKQMGKKGLVILLDNLDRLSEEQTHQIFNVGAKYLQQFPCHTVYTLPSFANLEMNVTNPSDSSVALSPNGDRPIPHSFLPALTLRDRQGEVKPDILALLRQVVLARVLPQIAAEERFQHLTQAFTDLAALDYLCIASEGYLPRLILLLYGCWQLQDRPFSMETVTAIVNDLSTYSDRHLS